jgi:hypothetical protein
MLYTLMIPRRFSLKNYTGSSTSRCNAMPLTAFKSGTAFNHRSFARGLMTVASSDGIAV